jgi:uncharacterized protein (DUF302 family)
MHYTEESNKSVQEVVDTIQKIVSNYGFGVQHIHNVKNTLNSKGIDFEKECQILDVCKPSVAKEFLGNDMSLSIIMPCKISVYTDNKTTNISMNSLTQLVDDINPDLLDLAQVTQEELLKIINEAK